MIECDIIMSQHEYKKNPYRIDAKGMLHEKITYDYSFCISGWGVVWEKTIYDYINELTDIANCQPFSFVNEIHRNMVSIYQIQA